MTQKQLVESGQLWKCQHKRCDQYDIPYYKEGINVACYSCGHAMRQVDDESK